MVGSEGDTPTLSPQPSMKERKRLAEKVFSVEVLILIFKDGPEDMAK